MRIHQEVFQEVWLSKKHGGDSAVRVELHSTPKTVLIKLSSERVNGIQPFPEPASSVRNSVVNILPCRDRAVILSKVVPNVSGAAPTLSSLESFNRLSADNLRSALFCNLCVTSYRYKPAC